MKTYDELTNEILTKAKAEKARRRKLTRRIGAGVAAFAVILGTVAVTRFTSHAPELPILATKDSDATNAILADAEGRQILSANADYGAVYDKLIIPEEPEYSLYDRFKATLSGITGVTASKEDAVTYAAYEEYDLEAEAPVLFEPSPSANGSDGDMPTERETSASARPDAPSYSGDDAESENKEYSETNIQVEGVMEADVVKTDGKYIYAVGRQNVFILSADEGKMEIVSKLPIADGDGILTVKDSGGEKKLVRRGETVELYVSGDRLIILTPAVDEEDRPNPAKRDYYYDYWYSGRYFLAATVISIEDRSAPEIISTVALSGMTVSTRMIENTVYLVTSDGYYDGIDRDDPETYVSKAICDGETYLMPADSIYCGEEKTDCKYLNVLALSASDGKVTDSVSLLGYDGELMYQSKDNIYVCRTEYSNDYNKGEPNDDGVVTETYSGSQSTVITKIGLADGLSLKGCAIVKGYLHNSFSLDEYEGYLRAVLSVDEYVDETRWSGDDEESYAWVGGDRRTVDMSNSLYVFDPEMKVVGSITGLAENERIYSARFEGTQAYFVTYRETDPLFHVDISDPKNPVVVDALKIPGHSDYLQRFGDLLFGFGQTDDGNLKLSMFSEDENGAMKELSTTSIPGVYYSEALYDHHAIMADAGRNIICFGANGTFRFDSIPTDKEQKAVGGVWYDGESYCYDAFRYFIISYGDDGFTVEGSFDLGADWPEAIRGLYIGDYFYVYQNGWYKNNITSINMKDYSVIQEQTLDETESEPYYKYYYGVEEDYVDPSMVIVD